MIARFGIVGRYHARVPRRRRAAAAHHCRGPSWSPSARRRSSRSRTVICQRTVGAPDLSHYSVRAILGRPGDPAADRAATLQMKNVCGSCARTNWTQASRKRIGVKPAASNALEIQEYDSEPPAEHARSPRLFDRPVERYLSATTRNVARDVSRAAGIARAPTDGRRGDSVRIPRASRRGRRGRDDRRATARTTGSASSSAIAWRSDFGSVPMPRSRRSLSVRS